MVCFLSITLLISLTFKGISLCDAAYFEHYASKSINRSDMYVSEANNKEINKMVKFFDSEALGIDFHQISMGHHLANIAVTILSYQFKGCDSVGESS